MSADAGPAPNSEAAIAEAFAALMAADGNGPVTLAAFLAEKLDPPAWLVADLIPKGPAVGGLVGAEKNGKSLAGLQLCFAVATGHSFLGVNVENPGPTLFVEYEGSRAALQKRVVTIATKYGALSVPVPVSLIHRPKVKIDTDEGERWLGAHCIGKALCVIGPVSKACAMGKENDPAEWQRLAERLQRIADGTGCTILLVHHTRKPDVKFGAPSKVSEFFHSVRGSNAYMGAVDIAIGVQRDPEETEGVLFYLERDGASGRMAYDFEVSSLCIWPSDRRLGRPTTEDRRIRVLAFIEAHPGCTRKDLMAEFEVTEKTVKDWLAMVAEDVVEATGERGAKTYSVR